MNEYEKCPDSEDGEHSPDWKTARYTDAPIDESLDGLQVTSIAVTCRYCRQSGSFPIQDNDVSWA